VDVDETSASTAWYARWITQAPLLLSRHLWVWPLLGAIVLGAVGLWSRSRVVEATHAELAARLQTVRDADVAALRLWFSEQEADAKSFAADVRIEGAIAELAALDLQTNGDSTALAESESAKTLRQYLQPLLEAQHYVDYVVVGTDRRIIAAAHPRGVGRPAPLGYDMFVERALSGRTCVSRPFARELNVTLRSEGPTMFVAAPVKNGRGAIVGVLGLRMKPEAEFSQIFSVARMGKTGEAYAFDRRGVMLTASRFDDELKKLGLIPKTPEATAILNLRLVDPGVELKPGSPLPLVVRAAAPRPGEAPKRLGPGRVRDDVPLTRLAAAATRGMDGVDVVGYRNYRGVQVVGAWAWLPEYGMGVATEVGTEEAFAMLSMVREVFLVLFLLLLLSAIGIFAFTLLVERLQASLRQSALDARRLGQYVLVEEVGRGSSGMVYRARHSLLRRPVAIKLLSPEHTNETTVADFEHEAQMTSQLTHPNTVAIYDYGRTPEGLFYYAMEYLSGIDLDSLVRRFGPVPEGRVIHILRQVCGSLAEAHRIGLIHRDIKPANIILTRRGGLCDLAKVVDFGLVKGRQPHDGQRKSSKAVVGTPHFMPPEAVERPESTDARSDLYSVGAVGYWLVTGKTLFNPESIEQLLECQVKQAPARPGERLGKAVSADLELLLMGCLAKAPEQRPASAEELETALGRCAAAGGWTLAEAAGWWKANLAGLEGSRTLAMAEKTMVIQPRA